VARDERVHRIEYRAQPSASPQPPRRQQSGSAVSCFEDVDPGEPATAGITGMDACHERGARDARAREHAVIEIGRRTIDQREAPVAIELFQRAHLASAHGA